VLGRGLTSGQSPGNRRGCSRPLLRQRGRGRPELTERRRAIRSWGEWIASSRPEGASSDGLGGRPRISPTFPPPPPRTDPLPLPRCTWCANTRLAYRASHVPLRLLPGTWPLKVFGMECPCSRGVTPSRGLGVSSS
jgi:hypothetical protein